MKLIIYLALVTSSLALKTRLERNDKHEHALKSFLHSLAEHDSQGFSDLDLDDELLASEQLVFPAPKQHCRHSTFLDAEATCHQLAYSSDTMNELDIEQHNPHISCKAPIKPNTTVCTELSIPFAPNFPFTTNIAKRAATKVVTYPGPSSEKRSPDYRVSVNGKDVFCYISYQYWPASKQTIQGRPVSPVTFCYFSFQGAVNIKVQVLSVKASTVTARPLSLGIKPKMKNGAFSFSLSKPTTVTFEPNGSLQRPLHLIANPLEKNIPSRGSSKIIYYGPGFHSVDPITIKDGQTLYIAGGAVVSFKPVSKVTATMQNGYGMDIYSVDPYVIGRWSKRVTVRGRGILCGRQALAQAKQRGVMLSFQGIEALVIEGVILRENGGWNIGITANKKALIDNVKIIGHYVNSDAMVISSSNTIVQNSFVHNADDGFQIKSWGPAVSQVVFRNNIIWSTVVSSFGIPCEVLGPISGISFQDSTVIHSVDPGRDQDKGVLGINSQGPAAIKNVAFKNIVIEDSVADYPLRVSNDNQFSGGSRGAVRGVTYQNIQQIKCLGCRAILSGHSQSANVQNIKLTNVKVKGSPLTSQRLTRKAFVSAVTISS